MVSFWRTMADLGGQKLQELGVLGTALGILWVLGIWMWWDITMGAYAERMPGTATYFIAILVVWIVVGLAVYLWQDPHGIRTGGSEGVA